MKLFFRVYILLFSVYLLVFVVAILREKFPNTKFLSSRILRYPVRIQENTDQKKLHIWIFFTHCYFHLFNKVFEGVNLDMHNYYKPSSLLEN